MKNYRTVKYDIEKSIINKYNGKTYFLKTYGCQMNEHDSENIRAMLEELGFKAVEDYTQADLIMLNTCSIREKALENKKTYNGNKDKIHFVNCKAEDYLVSKNETVFYFFNPFSPEIFHAVINRILDSFEKYPRTITLILYYPEDDTVFYLERHTTFERMDEIAASDAVYKDRRERFCLYRITV